MRILPPNIDDRSVEQIVQRAKTLAPFYTPEWKPTFEKEPGTALLNIFAYLLDNVLSRFNRAADKNFLAFLDMLDMALLPARSARVPVTFQLAEGALQNILIPSGTQLSAAAKDNVREELTFETEKNVLATPARLQRVLSIVPGEDKIFEHPTSFDENKPFQPFTGANVQEHVLYLAHSDLFNFKSMVNIELKINLDESSRNVGIASTDVLWEHWDGKSWLELDVSEDKTRTEEGKTLQKSGTLTLSKQCEGENAELEVIPGIKNRWIRARIIEALPFATASSLPKFDTLQAHVLPTNEVFPDLAFSSDVPIEFPKSLAELNSLVIQSTLKLKSNRGPEQGATHVTLESPSTLQNNDRVIFKGANGQTEEREIIEIDAEAGTEGGVIIYWDQGLEFDYSRSSAEIILATPIRATQKTRKVSVGEGDIGKFKQGKRVYLKHDDELEEAEVHDVSATNQTIELSALGSDRFAHTYSPGDKIILKEVEGVFPFGVQPRLFNSFYIASQEVFSKKNARVTMVFRISHAGTPATDIKPELSWEYWNGKGWQLLNLTKNEVDNFKSTVTDKQIEFYCPENFAPTEVLGQENYWIRVRLVDGDYGTIKFQIVEEVVPGTDTKIPVAKPISNVSPPAIIWLTMRYEPEFQNLDHCLAFNSLTYEDFSTKSKTRGEGFTPFQALDNRHDSLYLGFDKALTSGPLRLFFSVTEQQVQEATRPKIAWSYWDGRAEFWKKLTGVDNTEALTRTDELEILGSKDLARKKMFGQELYWLRGSLIEGQYESALELKGIYPNTTWAFQAGRVEDETLGASTGAMHQEFPLLRFPIIAQQVFVQEPNAPSALEKVAINKDEGEDAIQEVRDTSDKITGYRIRWHAVGNFFNSGPTDRHYQIDRARGRVRFGDGVRGMIPPAGENNISANYTFGGGSAGNSVEAGEITSLKAAIPTVKGVANPLPASGGSDTETADGVLVRGPQTFKHRERAVTAEDYEWLARAASQSVARAKCLPNVNNLGLPELGWITVIIVPGNKESKPLPSPQLLTQVSRFLSQHAVNSVIAPRHLHVTRPAYVEVRVTAEVVPASLDEAANAEKNILAELDNFFHPLTGGPDKRGWAFGSTIMVSQVYTLLESIREVAYVKGLALSAEGRFSREKIAIPEHALVCSGAHDIRVILEEDNVSAYS